MSPASICVCTDIVKAVFSINVILSSGTLGISAYSAQGAPFTGINTHLLLLLILCNDQSDMEASGCYTFYADICFLYFLITVYT